MTGYRFLLMLKPEANRVEVDRPGLLDLVNRGLARHGVRSLNQVEHTGASLRAAQALDHLYVRLSFIAREGVGALSTAERDELSRQTGAAKILSADQACAALGVSASTLCVEGDRSMVVKLGPGAYAAHIVERQAIVLNHFVPEYQERYYSNLARIVAFECWVEGPELVHLRDMLVGDIRPDRARAGSLRAEAFAQAVNLRLGEVSVARNFFHISPGHLEALYQLAYLFPRGGDFASRFAGGEVARRAGLRLPSQGRAELARLFAATELASMAEATQVAQH